MKFKKYKTLIGETTSGSEKFLEVYEFNSEKPGKTIYLQGNMHGPEIAGILLLKKLIKYLKINNFSGKFIIIPSANPWGLDDKFEGLQGGYSNHNSSKFSNWNRIFPDLSNQIIKRINKSSSVGEIKTIAKQINKQKFKKLNKNQTITKEDILVYNLMKYSLDADIIIDIHTAGNCIKHTYTFNHNLEDSLYFQIQNIVKLPYKHCGVFDESHIIFWKNLKDKKFINEIPIKAFTIELFGNAYSSAKNVTSDFQKLLNYLKHEKAINGNSKLLNKSFQLCDSKNQIHITSPIGGIFHSNVQLGDKIEKGSLLGTIYGKKTIKIISAFKGIIYQMPKNHAVETGQEIFGIFSNIKHLKLN